MDSIESFDEELTVVIIAHRITTLKSCDMIIKLGSDYTMQTLSYEELMNFKNNEGDLNVGSNSSILVTGGTGSFGSTFIPMTLKKYNPRRIVFSRDEMKQWDMAKLYKDDPRIRFFIGDVRDKDRLCRVHWMVLIT